MKCESSTKFAGHCRIRVSFVSAFSKFFEWTRFYNEEKIKQHEGIAVFNRKGTLIQTIFKNSSKII